MLIVDKSYTYKAQLTIGIQDLLQECVFLLHWLKHKKNEKFLQVTSQPFIIQPLPPLNQMLPNTYIERIKTVQSCIHIQFKS